MTARAPLDVDLEDKLLYGLTPMRLGYVVLALLGAFALWSSIWAATPFRAAACVVVLLGSAALAWGRWRGRAVDGWLTDIAAFIARNQRVVWNESWVVLLKRRPWPWSVAAVVASETNEIEGEPSDEITQLAFPDAAIAAS
jgi:PrgI family protein